MAQGEETLLELDLPSFYEQIPALSPSHTVPALHLGDEVLWESLAILETLADRYPHAQLWPSDPVLRAYARCISAEMHSGFPALRREMPMNCRVRDRHIDLSDHARRDIDRVLAIWAQCDDKRNGARGGLLGGFTVADAMYAPVASRFLTYGIELPESARRFVDFVHADPDMRQWQAAAEAETRVIEDEEQGQP